MIKPDWQSDDGAVTLYCADCLSILPQLEADCIITDPPYGETKCGWDKQPSWERWFADAHRAVPDAGVIACFASMRSAAAMIGANGDYFRYDLVWEKTRPAGFLSAGCRPMRAHELILIFAQRWGNTGRATFPATYNPQMSGGEAYSRRDVCEPSLRNRIYNGESKMALRGVTRQYRGRHPRSVIKFVNQNDRQHPTQKPVDLMQWLVSTYSNEGNAVVDPFSGSGSTGVACVKTGRKFIGIEISPDYFAIAKKRIQQAIRERSEMLIPA